METRRFWRSSRIASGKFWELSFVVEWYPGSQGATLLYQKEANVTSISPFLFKLGLDAFEVFRRTLLFNVPWVCWYLRRRRRRQSCHSADRMITRQSLDPAIVTYVADGLPGSLRI
ncbi:unnamed protein product [Peniophora sp. CBMAI 1063]|nr:unnamed protein product [Peniophora sp. CBMAI 1063]